MSWTCGAVIWPLSVTVLLLPNGIIYTVFCTSYISPILTYVEILDMDWRRCKQKKKDYHLPHKMTQCQDTKEEEVSRQQ